MKTLFSKLLIVKNWFDTTNSRKAWFDDEFSGLSQAVVQLTPDSRYTAKALSNKVFTAFVKNNDYKVAA